MSRAALNAQCGFSLIGVMIALVLGAFLLAGVLQVFVSAKQTFAVQDGLSRLQENGRSAMDFMGRTIRMTGYWACLRGAGDLSGADGADGAPDSITLRGAFTPAQIYAIQIGCKDNPLTGCAGWTAEKIAITPRPACRSSVLPGDGYVADSSATVAYSVANNVLSATPGGELIEGVENMQILYGEDTDGDGSANYYVPANQVVNMENVVAVRVSLLLRSLEDNLTAEPVPYTYNGVTTTPADRRLRRVFTSTFGLRNRLP